MVASPELSETKPAIVKEVWEEPVEPKYTIPLLTPPMTPGPHVCASYANLLPCGKLHISLTLNTWKKKTEKERLYNSAPSCHKSRHLQIKRIIARLCTYAHFGKVLFLNNTMRAKHVSTTDTTLWTCISRKYGLAHHGSTQLPLLYVLPHAS